MQLSIHPTQQLVNDLGLFPPEIRRIKGAAEKQIIIRLCYKTLKNLIIPLGKGAKKKKVEFST